MRERYWQEGDMRPERAAGRLAAFVLVSALAVVLAAEVSGQGPSPYTVIVNPANPVAVGSATWVSEFFLKKKVKWDSGEPVEPVDLSGEPGVRDAFSTDIHAKTSANVRSYWNQEVFSGRATPPLELPSSAAVVDYVRSHPNAIGYVAATTSLDGVKQLSILVPPRVVSRVEPRYPATALAARRSGDVVLNVEVTKTGTVGKVTALKELGFGLTAEAVKAVRLWKFEAGKRDGVPAAQEIQITVTFAPPQ
jgi:TonB family protein